MSSLKTNRQKVHRRGTESSQRQTLRPWILFAPAGGVFHIKSSKSDARAASANELSGESPRSPRNEVFLFLRPSEAEIYRPTLWLFHAQLNLQQRSAPVARETDRLLAAVVVQCFLPPGQGALPRSRSAPRSSTMVPMRRPPLPNPSLHVQKPWSGLLRVRLYSGHVAGSHLLVRNLLLLANRLRSFSRLQFAVPVLAGLKWRAIGGLGRACGRTHRGRKCEKRRGEWPANSVRLASWWNSRGARGRRSKWSTTVAKTDTSGWCEQNERPESRREDSVTAAFSKQQSWKSWQMRFAWVVAIFCQLAHRTTREKAVFSRREDKVWGCSQRHLHQSSPSSWLGLRDHYCYNHPRLFPPEVLHRQAHSTLSVGVWRYCERHVFPQHDQCVFWNVRNCDDVLPILLLNAINGSGHFRSWTKNYPPRSIFGEGYQHPGAPHAIHSQSYPQYVPLVCCTQHQLPHTRFGECLLVAVHGC